MTAKNEAVKEVRLTLVRSIFGRLENHRACVRGLGLTRMHQTVQVKATPEIMGMVHKVAFMLKVEEA
jgi:large subunit ribosomal protein L30